MKSERNIVSMKSKKLWFYIIFSALPLAQTAIFYFYVNSRSFALAFQNYDAVTNTYSFAAFGNFRKALSDLLTLEYLQSAIANSLILYVVLLLFGSFPSILFSYYIYKKRLMAGFYKVILYLPHIISTVVFTLIFKYFMEDAVPAVAEMITGNRIQGLLYDVSHMDRIKVIVMAYTVWMSFGTSVLMYSSAMSGISDSIIESGQLEGVTPMKELLFIVLPMIWPTFITFMVTLLTGIFTNQMHLYTIFGQGAEYQLYTFGYFLYRSTLIAELKDYPYLSAMGLLMTCVAVPVTLLVRYALKKFGPSVE